MKVTSCTLMKAITFQLVINYEYYVEFVLIRPPESDTAVTKVLNAIFFNSIQKSLLILIFCIALIFDSSHVLHL